MNKILWILTAIGFVFLFGGLYFFNQNSRVEPPLENATEQTPQEIEVLADSINERPIDAYVEYSPDTFQSLGNKRRVLFFYASWCPTCKAADIDFKSNIDKLPEDLVLIRVNYNDPSTDGNEKALGTQYGITYQHTFVQIDEDGHEITKWNGGETDELLKKLK